MASNSSPPGSDAPPLHVWGITLLVCGVIGVLLVLAFLLLDDPLSYLASVGGGSVYSLLS